MGLRPLFDDLCARLADEHQWAVCAPEVFPGLEHMPLDVVRLAPKRKVMAIVGTADPMTPASEVDDLEAVGATVVRYEGAQHGFVHDPSRPTHRAADAANAWARAIAFLEAGDR
jgi:dienelactone hydrolase